MLIERRYCKLWQLLGHVPCNIDHCKLGRTLSWKSVCVFVCVWGGGREELNMQPNRDRKQGMIYCSTGVNMPEAESISTSLTVCYTDRARHSFYRLLLELGLGCVASTGVLEGWNITIPKSKPNHIGHDHRSQLNIQRIHTHVILYVESRDKIRLQQSDYDSLRSTSQTLQSVPFFEINYHHALL